MVLSIASKPMFDDYRCCLLMIIEHAVYDVHDSLTMTASMMLFIHSSSSRCGMT